MSDVYLMLGVGLDQCHETQDYLQSGRPMQLVSRYKYVPLHDNSVIKTMMLLNGMTKKDLFTQ